MDARPVAFILGWFVVIIGSMMVLPALVDVSVDNADWQVFAASSMASVFGGLAMVLASRGWAITLNLRQGFLLTVAAWVAIALVGSLPFAFSANLGFTYSDAFFESMSGLTTTGSTVMSGLDAAPPGILLWRGILQWLGGIGIIVMAVAMFPFLKVGGMQLFRMESSDTSEKVVPKVKTFMILIVTIYLFFTVVLASLLKIEGMTALEAAVHAMTAISTGGYSTSDGSVGHFASPVIDWTITAFMLLGALPFVLYIRLLKGAPLVLFRDSQVRAFVAFLFVVIGGLTLWLVLVDAFPVFDAVTLAAFNVVSVVTTTGFATADYSQWGTMPVELFLLLTFVGGCTGSTAGGIKIFRFEIAWLGLKQYLWRRLYPSGVRVPIYRDQPVADEVVAGVLLFMFSFVLITGLVALTLGLMGLDMITAITGAATAMANVGPGLGTIIGPSGNFDTLPEAAKWVLSAAMLLGRLEIFTVLVLLQPAFWRH